MLSDIDIKNSIKNNEIEIPIDSKSSVDLELELILEF